MRGIWIAVPIALGAIVACSSSSGSSGSSCPSTSSLCTGKGKCMVVCPSMSETDISADFASVGTGDTIVFETGAYEFNMQLALGMADDVTVVGAGMGKTILDFHAQAQADDAIFAQGPMNNLTLESMTVKDSPGNAFKTLDVTGMTFKSLEVTWTAMDHTDGPYGVYPVQDKNVLVEDCKISGASDSGIYIGQSQNIVVRNNEAFQNVAGIEIENSFFADVYGNDAHDNTGGILVFDLPNLQQEGGNHVRVFNNKIVNNNTKNFAMSGDIVHIVPAGTGSFVMANHDVEVFGNTITGNKTAGFGIISYAVSQQTFTDPHYYEWPKRVYAHDNTWGNNGTAPDVDSQVGLLLITGTTAFPNGHVPDVMYDGIVDPMAMADPAYPQNVMTICVHEPTASAVCNGHFDKLSMSNPDLSKTIDCNASQFACMLPPLPAVTWTGLPAQ